MPKDQAQVSLLKPAPPEDKYGLIFWMHLLLGAGSLLAYNVIITCIDYLDYEYPGYSNIELLLLPTNIVPNLFFQVFMIKYGHKLSFSVRVIILFVCTAILVGIIPYIAQNIADESKSFTLFLLVVAILGSFAAIIQSSVFGFAGLLPGKYVQAVVSGQAIAGILASFLRIFTKAFVKSETKSALVYFVTAAAVSFSCALAFILILRAPFTVHHLQDYYGRRKIAKLEKKQKALLRRSNSPDGFSVNQLIANNALTIVASPVEESLTSISSASSLPSHNLMPPTNHTLQTSRNNTTTKENSANVNESTVAPDESLDSYQSMSEVQIIKIEPNIKDPRLPVEINTQPKQEKVSYLRIFSKIKFLAFAVFINLLITFLVFPGLTVGINSQYNDIQDGSWMPIILITEFNICDLFGRIVLASYITFGMNQKTLWVGCLMRILAYPCFYILYKGIITNDIVAHACMIITALTNGHFCCLAFVWAPTLCKEYEREIGASILSFCLIGGIASGSVIALGLGYII